MDPITIELLIALICFIHTDYCMIEVMKNRLYDLLIGENIGEKDMVKDDDDVPVFVAAPMVRYSK